MEIDFSSPRRSPLAAAAPRAPRVSLALAEEKAEKKIEEVISRPCVSDEGCAGNPGRHALSPPARRDRQGPPRPTRPGRLRSARRPQAAQGCRARGTFVLSNKAAQDARALRADELRPRRIEGVSWSRILCRNGRSVRRWCARVATQKTAAQTATKSLLPCPRLPGNSRLLITACLLTIARHCAALRGKKILPLSKCPCTVSRSRSASRRAPLAAAPCSSCRSAAAAVILLFLAMFPASRADDRPQFRGPDCSGISGHDEAPSREVLRDGKRPQVGGCRRPTEWLPGPPRHPVLGI